MTNPYHPDPGAGSPILTLLPGQVIVHIDNTYLDGHECAASFAVDGPQLDDVPEDVALDAWWDEEVQPLSGCGHGAPEYDDAGVLTRRTMDAYSKAEITQAGPSQSRLVGEFQEWDG